jgi:hypothetical protein
MRLKLTSSLDFDMLYQPMDGQTEEEAEEEVKTMAS